MEIKVKENVNKGIKWNDVPVGEVAEHFYHGQNTNTGASNYYLKLPNDDALCLGNLAGAHGIASADVMSEKYRSYAIVPATLTIG